MPRLGVPEEFPDKPAVAQFVKGSGKVAELTARKQGFPPRKGGNQPSMCRENSDRGVIAIETESGNWIASRRTGRWSALDRQSE
jgi:hypothetical protein